MSQKKNKIILVISVCLLSLFILTGWLMLKGQESSLLSLKERKLVKNCENVLRNDSESLYKICKIEDGRIVVLNSTTENKGVKPGERVIISLNMPKLLAQEEWINPLTNKKITKPNSEDPISLCYNFYPTLMPEQLNRTLKYTFPSISQSEIDGIIDNFYQDFKWEVFPQSLFNQNSRGGNFICTKAFPISKVPITSLFLSLPQKNVFSAASGGIIIPDFSQYGIKILLASSEIMNSDYSPAQIVNMVPRTN